jgi:hypothetical protein
MNQEIDIGIGSVPHKTDAGNARHLAKVDPASLSPLNTIEHGLLATYDFTKHTSMLSLVAMGGMLGLAQSNGQPLSRQVLVSVVIVGLAGFLSMAFMAVAAATQISQRAHKTNKWFSLVMVQIILLLFTAGVTVFFKAVSQAGN